MNFMHIFLVVVRESSDSVSATSPKVLVSSTKDDNFLELKLQGSRTDLCDANGASCLSEPPQCSSFYDGAFKRLTCLFASGGER